MKGFINHDDYLARLPKDRQERIQAKTNELLAKIESEKQTLNPMIARAMANENPSVIADIDAVELQRQWRNEW